MIIIIIIILLAVWPGSSELLSGRGRLHQGLPIDQSAPNAATPGRRRPETRVSSGGRRLQSEVFVSDVR